jgi:pimeloyl-ACP methyl ester carboxylesterase
MRRRISATRWPERETVDDDSQGVPLATMQQLARYWSSDSVPFAISVFPDELYQAPRSWAERAYPDNLIHFNEVDRGGHFAAWEQPGLLTEELRAAFRSLRT